MGLQEALEWWEYEHKRHTKEVDKCIFCHPELELDDYGRTKSTESWLKKRVDEHR